VNSGIEKVFLTHNSKPGVTSKKEGQQAGIELVQGRRIRT